MSGNSDIETRSPMDRWVNRRVFAVLEKHYPSWTWFIDANTAQSGGIITIRLMDMNATHGMVLKLREISNLEHAVRNAGGELLNRFRQPRKGKDPDRVKAEARDPRGNASHET